MRVQVIKGDQIGRFTRWVGKPLHVPPPTAEVQEPPQPAGPTPEELLAEARRVLVEAQQQADQMRQDAVRKGYEDGLQIGREEGRRDYQQAIANLQAEVQKLVDALLAERQRLWEEMEDRKSVV